MSSHSALPAHCIPPPATSIKSTGPMKQHGLGSHAKHVAFSFSLRSFSFLSLFRRLGSACGCTYCRCKNNKRKKKICLLITLLTDKVNIIFRFQIFPKYYHRQDISTVLPIIFLFKYTYLFYFG